MRLICAAFVCCFPLLAQDVTFQFKPLQPGDARVKSTINTVSIDVKVMRGTTAVNSQATEEEDTKEKSETILAVKDGEVTALKVAYWINKSSAKRPGDEKPAERIEPVSGKSYKVEQHNGTILVTDELGGAVPDAEKDFVSRDYSQMIRPSPFGKIFSGKTFTLGQKVELPPDAMKEFFGRQKLLPGAEPQFDLTLKELRQSGGYPCAVLAGSIRIAAPEDKISNRPAASFELIGEILVGVENCWPVHVALEGPLKISGTQGDGAAAIKIEGSGKVSIKGGFRKL